jgi:hypothetical protein
VRVLAIDPGEKCGYATGEITDGKLELLTYGIADLKDMALKTHEVISNYDVLVVESYRISATHVKHHIGSDVPTLQVIGALRLCAWLNPKVRIVMQAPAIKSTANATMPPELQKIIDAAPKAHDQAHHTDAIRHLHHFWWKRHA